MIESFAFLTARLLRRLYAEFPEITDVTWLPAVPSRIEESGHAHP